MRTDFCRDVFAGKLAQIFTGGKQCQLLGGSNMQHMQFGIVFFGQLNRHAGWGIARICRADIGMFPRRNIFTVFFAGCIFQQLDHRRIFTMRCNQHRCFTEDGGEGLAIIDQHITGGCTHENLDATGLVRFQPFDLFQVVVRSTKIEAVVGNCLLTGQFIFGFQRFHCYCLRSGVRHFHKTGSTTSNSSPWFTG